MEKGITEELSKYLRKVGKLAGRAGWGRSNRSKLFESSRTAGKLLVQPKR